MMTTASTKFRVNPALSDLFFNHDHPAFDALSTPTAPGKKVAPLDPSDMHAALMKDAEGFASLCAQAFGVDVKPAALVVDFLRRL